MSDLFSSDSKPSKPDIIDSNNCCYHFKCTCSSHYVGMTARKIKTRDKEHRNPSSAKGIYYHINSCPSYLTKVKDFENQNLAPNSGPRVKKKS